MHNCKIKRVYLKTNYNQFKVKVYGNYRKHQTDSRISNRNI